MAGSVNLERALYLRERHRWCVEDEAVDTGPAGCFGHARLRETDAPVGKLEPPVYSAGLRISRDTEPHINLSPVLLTIARPAL
jgi:hypothetical protein